ncbi:T-lymphocyte surface antigen Ly-9-like [Lithobates pipiens]
MRAPFTMRSQTALLLLCVLHQASSANAQDLYVAAEEKIVIPLETRLDRTSGQFCNRLIWRYQPSPDQFAKRVAEVSDSCQKTEYKKPASSLSDNGSLIIHRVTHQDSGLYNIITYHLNNNKNTEKEFQLHVLDVVSDPVVTLQCLSNDSLLVTCAVENGTKPQILLTINREEFRESEMGLINVTTLLPPPWNISCSANNKVSQKMTNVFRKSCQADPQDLYVAAEEKIVIPLETRLDRTSGQFCNRLIWRYQSSADPFPNHIAEVTNSCQKMDCKKPACSLSDNGSLILHRVTHQDSGLYNVITYHLNNNRNTEKEFQLHVLDVVSDPVVTLQCLSNDSLLVTCAVEQGTKPQILLTINRQEFRESEMGLINVTTSLPPPWNISCSATNNVSQKMTNVFHKSCQSGPEIWGHLLSFGAVFVLYTTLLVFFVNDLRKRKN